jgi:hypothetical protein
VQLGGGQHVYLEIAARHVCPGVALLNNHRSFVSPVPGNNSPIRPPPWSAS